MTTEKLQEAIALHADIKKAKDFLSILESEKEFLCLSDGESSVTFSNGPLREHLKVHMRGIVESMEREFSWL